MKRTLFKDPIDANKEEKKCRGGGDKKCCDKCFQEELFLKHWARNSRPGRNGKPIGVRVIIEDGRERGKRDG